MSKSHLTLQLASFIFQSTIALILTASLCPNLSAQTSANQSEADRLYAQQGYHSAAEKYEASQKQDTETLERLAHSYRLIHDTQNAEKYYAQIIAKSYDPANYLYYAQALQSNGKPELAKEYFQKYDSLKSSNGDKRGNHFLHNTADSKLPIDETIVLENLQDINSGQLDFSPVIFENGIVFASTRLSPSATQQLDKWTGEAYSSLYFVENQDNGSFSTPSPFPLGLGSAFHEGPLAFSKNRNLLYYTRNVSQKNEAGKKEYFLKIATAVKEGKLWLKDDLLDLGGQAKPGHQSYNDVHPTLSEDGRQLVFASDRPGGYGGMDLYISYYSDGKWRFPINLGPAVNTAGNEVFPFLGKNADLYFASDGWGGFGGLDIFCAKTNNEGDWASSANIGLPFNSPKDDFGLVLDNSNLQGYLTSARDGGLGRDDIYRFSSKEPLADKLRQDITVTHHYDPIFSPKEIEETTAKTDNPTSFLNELENASTSGASLQLDYIYYDYGQSAIRPDAAKELNVLVQFLNSHPTLSIELISHTDSRGEAIYNKELSEMRAQAAAHYLIQQGIPASRVTAIGMGEAQLLNDCKDGKECSEEEHQVNRRTEVRFY